VNRQERRLRRVVAWLRESAQFVLVAWSDEGSRGERVTLERPGLRIEFVRDYADFFVDLQPLDGWADDGFGLGVWSRVLENNRNVSDKLGRSTMMFLRRQLGPIERRLAIPEERDDLIRRLVRARNERAVEMFGPLPDGFGLLPDE
jgi:hypothetical protein